MATFRRQTLANTKTEVDFVPDKGRENADADDHLTRLRFLTG